MEPQNLVDFLNDHYSNVKENVNYVEIYPDPSPTANKLLFDVVKEAPISKEKGFDGDKQIPLANDNQDLEELGEEFKEHFPGSEYEKIGDNEMRLNL